MSSNPVHCLVELNVQLNLLHNKEVVFLVLVVVLAFLGVQHGLLAGLWCFLALHYCVGHDSRALGNHSLSSYLRGVVCLLIQHGCAQIVLLCSA